MKMTIVSAFNIIEKPKFELVSKPALEGITGKSYDALFAHLTEGDSVTVEVPGKGYKNISIKGGEHFIQRNFAPEY